MEIILRVAGPAGGEAEDLLGWLLERPELSGKVTPARPGGADGAQGPASDALAVAVGSGGPLTALALCLKTWIQAHYAQRKANVHIEVTAADGRRAVIDASNAEEAEKMLRQVTG